jgi:hypothetical protein
MLKRILVFLLVCLSFEGFAQINMVVKPGGFLFLEGNDSIFFYQKSPIDQGGKFSRCNYIHPLYGSDGTRMTEDFPADHLHHRGVFWAWHQILIDNTPISDGWELKDFDQKVSSFEFKLLKGIGIINTIVDWKSPLWKEDKTPYLQEKTTISIYHKIGNYRRIDFEIHLKALADRFQIGGSADEKGYSGFSVRLKLPEDVTFRSEKDLIEPVTNAVDAGNFMNINGSFLKNGKEGGVVILSNPENPAPANSWIIRKSASMQNAVFPGRNPVAIPFGESLILKYSLLVYQGEMSTKQIQKAMN